MIGSHLLYNSFTIVQIVFMKPFACFLIAIIFFLPTLKAQSDIQTTKQTDTSSLDLKIFAGRIVSGSNTNFQKARTLLEWLSHSFAWTATDYQQRTVKQIIVRQGGNCFELAKVYMALINELGIQYRPIAEINLHVPSEQREKTSEGKIKDAGNTMSVFGYQHNDHRWVEVYDDSSHTWIPVDPTMDLIGFDQWLKGRAWFESRHTINDEFSSDMIAPFAIFVVDKNDKSKMIEDRTQEYMVKQLDRLYQNKLAGLPSWQQWIDQLKNINSHARNAFAGTENLHDYGKAINDLRNTYDRLKEEWLQSKKN